MSEYTYHGIDRKGTKVKGVLDAESEGDARVQLRNQGVRPTKIVSAGSTEDLFSSDLGVLIRKATGGSVSEDVLVPLTKQLQVLIESGVTIVQSLDILQEGAADKTIQNAFRTIRDRVNQGTFLWEGMAMYPHIFPRIYVALVRAGESAGALDQVLSRLTTYLETTQKLKSTVKKAMIYPVSVICVAILVIILMMLFVIPKFKDILANSGQEMPALTQMILNMSELVTSHFGSMILSTGVSIFLSFRFARSKEGRAFLDKMLFKIPYFGNLIRLSAIARFSRTIQTLLHSGMNLIDAIEICKSTIGNVVIEEAVGKIKLGVEAGKTISGMAQRVDVFPKMAIQMIHVGEKTGNLDGMMEKLADYYEAEVENATSGLLKMLEPLLLVLLGGVIAGILVALYLPIFKMAGGAQ